MAYENIIVEKKEEGIVKITLNRPQVLNALNNASYAELKAALEDIQRDENVAVVILTGAGHAFSAGRDLKATDDFLEGDEVIMDVFTLLEKLGPPVIAAVNGYAITGGLALALSCDIVVASENAVFRDNHAQVGVFPDGSTSQKLPRLVGEKKAKEILFTSDLISGSEAERIGLVNKVVPPEKLEEEVMLLAKKIASQPKPMIRSIKQIVTQGMRTDLEAAMMLVRIENLRRQATFKREEIAQQGRQAIEEGRKVGKHPF
ncbi:enoyl-CoA hydratase/isomerase family protein [Chloroflexota bacterium]